MRRPWRWTVTALTILATGASVAWAGLPADVESAIHSTDLQGAEVAVSIRECDTDVELVSINSSAPMIPASNMKLLTTGAALHVLGPRFDFRTSLRLDGDRLIVVGDGDPGFGDPELLRRMQHAGAVGIDVDTFLAYWIDAVVEAGVEQVSEVVVDDRIYDREFVHPSWPTEQLNKRYCAGTSGLSFHLNVLHFFPVPSSGGRPDLSDVQPRTRWLSPANKATCRTGRDARDTVWIARGHRTNRLTVYGNVKHAHREPVEVTLHDVPTFFAHLLAERLKRAGVNVNGWGVLAPDDPDPRESGRLVGPVISTPISTAVTRCNRDSQNMYAESLIKRIGYEMTGRPGSWRDGTAIVRHVVAERIDDAVLTTGLIVTDGSGLSRDNRVTAGVMTAWLATFHRDEALGTILIESLAEPGQPGTLLKRFGGTNLHGARVQAKSGFINRVSCLTGFVTAADGRRRAFSILINDLSVSTSRAKTLQERIVAAIAKDLVAAEVTLGSD